MAETRYSLFCPKCRYALGLVRYSDYSFDGPFDPAYCYCQEYPFDWLVGWAKARQAP